MSSSNTNSESIDKKNNDYDDHLNEIYESRYELDETKTLDKRSIKNINLANDPQELRATQTKSFLGNNIQSETLDELIVKGNFIT